MRPVIKVAATAAAVTLALAACGSKPGSTGSTASAGSSGTSSSTSSSTSGATSGSAAGAALKACMVLDTGGVDDRSFNQSSWAGMQAANKANPKISIKYVPSNSQSDYVPNLTKLAQQKCDPVIAVGGLMDAAVKATAKKYPKTHFAEIDDVSEGANDYGIQFNTAQAAFLGGYLAAGMTKTGVVGTWGGLPIPPVTIYMDGFWEGVQYYNKTEKKSVKVVGWNEKSPKSGIFVNGNNAFTDQNKGKSLTQQEASQGADIVFPVAGSAGLGAGAAAQSANGKLRLMWVDTDGCVSASQYCKYFISSVTKNLSGGVQKYLEAAASGTYPTGNYVGVLKDNGVGLAPFHDFASGTNGVPATLQAKLKVVRAAIISGSIKITSPNQPKS